MNKTQPDFFGLGIAPGILETLTRLKFKHPTPIQHKAIPVALDGKDLVGVAQTGTGKTLAFGIPLVQRLVRGKSRALVLVPTRELALQVKESLAKIAQAQGLKLAVLIGGAPQARQVQALQKNPRIIIATPGRLIDLKDQRKVNLGDTGMLVLDEADRMLDMGFAPQITQILKAVPKDRQTMLFSATMPPSIVKMAAMHMKAPVSVEIAPPGTAAEKVSHELYIVRKDMKRDLLDHVLKQYRGSVLLFCRTKRGTMRIARALRAKKYRAAEIHSDRTLGQRKEALEGFKSGKYRILAATDIAARGIDVKGIELVINYDLPEDAENYVHRIGRTGRAGKAGHAISFAMPDQRTDVRNIERLINQQLPISKRQGSTEEQFDKPKSVFSATRVRGRLRMSGSFRARRR